MKILMVSRLFIIFIVALALLIHVNENYTPSAVADDTVRVDLALGSSEKDVPPAKISQDLAALHEEYSSYQERGDVEAQGTFQSGNPSLQIIRMGDIDYVAVDAIASEDPDLLLSDLKSLGMKKAAMFKQIISGWLPISAIADMAELYSLKFARASYSLSGVGLTTSQGDAAMRSDVARTQFGVDGSGVTVGVISDSFDCLGGAAGDVASGDLPPGIVVLDDSLCPTEDDEGRAMMQIIHDVAPGADLIFHTRGPGEASIAQAVVNLADAGVDIIVDDVVNTAEPLFQDGIIAREVDAAVGMGIPYFAFAGNYARDSYESAFNPSGLTADLNSRICEFHDFDPGAGVDVSQSVTIPEGTVWRPTFQWDSPFFSLSPGSGGSPNDLAILLLRGNTAVAFSDANNIGGDPLETTLYLNPVGSGMTDFDIAILHCEGPIPQLMKYILYTFDGTINEFNTASPTIVPHANAEGAEAVGAAFYFETPEFGTSPPVLESFSSRGPIPIIFDADGNRLSSPIVRMKPEIVAPDGANTTFFGGGDSEGDGFPNFFGTSAASPHAVAVAALMLEANPPLTPAEVYSAMENTAIDMDDPDTSGFDTGFDFATGFGFVQADGAVQAVALSSSSDSDSGCAIAGRPVHIGTSLINILILLIPASAVGYRVLRKKKLNRAA